MSIKKTLAGVLAGAVVASAAFVAVGAPASATDEGDNFLGTGILWFNAVGELSAQSPATYITSGANATNGGNLGTGRPWATMTTLTPCPAGSAQLTNYVRIPQTGVPEINWPQVAIGANSTKKDADGRFYTDQVLQADRLNKSEVMSYLATQPGNTATIPLISVCRDNLAISTGYFRTMITFTGTTGANLTWSIPATADIPYAAPTTTAVAVSPAGPVTAGTPVTFTATVAPSTATGSVQFKVDGVNSGAPVPVAGGTASLVVTDLTVATHSVTAQFIKTGLFGNSTSAPASITVDAPPAVGTTTVLAVDVVAGEEKKPVTFDVTVSAASGTPAGTVTITDGAVTIATFTSLVSGTASTTLSNLAAGAHSFVATFVPADATLFSGSVSAAVTATYTAPAFLAKDDQTVVVTIPTGAITITTPYTPEHPLDLGTAQLDPATSTYYASVPFGDGTMLAGPDAIVGTADDVYSGIQIVDTRTGQLGFTASVIASDFTTPDDEPGAPSFGGNRAGLVNLHPVQLGGNALQATDITTTDRPAAPIATLDGTGGLSATTQFASYPAGKSLGTARITGVFELKGIPTSVEPGLYTSTVTFTVN